MIVGTPLVNMKQEMLLRLSQGSGFAGEERDSLANGEIEVLNEDGLDVGREAMFKQDRIGVTAFTPEHVGNGEGDFATFATLDELTMKSAIIRAPRLASS